MNREEYAKWCKGHNINYFFHNQKLLTTKKLETLYEDLIPHIALEQLTNGNIFARLAARHIEQILKERNHVPTSESPRSSAESRRTR